MSKLIDEFCSFLNVLAFTLLLFPSCCLSTIRTRYTVPSCPQTSLSFVSKFSSGIASRYRPTYGFVLCLHSLVASRPDDSYDQVPYCNPSQCIPLWIGCSRLTTKPETQLVFLNRRIALHSFNN